MTDFLLAHPLARRLVKSVGVPVPYPLRRAEGPCSAHPLAGRVADVGGHGDVVDALKAALASAGASEGGEPDVLAFDATGIADVAGLRTLYDFFHPRLRAVGGCGRVVVVGRPPADAPSAEAAAARQAIDGFVRSVGKELGRRGGTANLLQVAAGAEDRIEGPLRYLASDRSAFVSCQALEIGTDVAAAPPRWTRPLEGQVALVTGAARGIGATTARRLADEGARVVCMDLPADEEACRALATSIGGTALPADVTASDTPARLAEHLGRDGVDIVVHNAGITRDRTLAKMAPEQWDQALAVNLQSLVAITAALVDGGLRDSGRIVCMSSVAGIAGNLGQANYAASKAGVIGFVRGWAGRLADRGITVNAVAPGFIETRLTAAIPFGIREAARRLSCLAQGGVPSDVAEAVTFLATPGAAGVTGQVLRVCGGAFIGA